MQKLSAMATKPVYTARTADKYVLYQESVQNTEFEVQMVERFFKKFRGQSPVLLREDFSGTFLFACDWVRRNKKYQALCVDIDPEPIQWGRKHNLSQLSQAEQSRITIKEADVLKVHKPLADIVVAFNFSYWLFKEREQLKTYFQSVYQSLGPKGMFVMDSFGGSAAHSEQEEPRKCEGFEYIWEHEKFHPLTSEMRCKIHFNFKDGTKIRNAFVYDWRLWTPLEVRELLGEVGFQKVEFYWEGTDQETGEGNGIFRPAKRGEAAECWIAYIIGLK
ncbi:MAG: class I SAM-dependent methyltransferase [Leptospiraceae bacterium]|nr:class I SAM-dependent methyltransferase [Leptospiraceae bacterium]